MAPARRFTRGSRCLAVKNRCGRIPPLRRGTLCRVSLADGDNELRARWAALLEVVTLLVGAHVMIFLQFVAGSALARLRKGVIGLHFSFWCAATNGERSDEHVLSVHWPMPECGVERVDASAYVPAAGFHGPGGGSSMRMMFSGIGAASSESFLAAFHAQDEPP